GGNPRRALDLARRLLTDPQAAEALRHDVLHRRETVERLGAAAAMLLTELETSGPASASDPGLLARLGWTRARATQVLSRLEEAGLVEASAVPDGPGRPRKVYRATGPASGGAPGRAGPPV
ncbi:MAG TPA: hypothetical protein VLW53_03100, partial [Candidatus Eisenbacteria bacterium]|nr:hypothetical protein [Candidatus Eisenbacteria bacterium]